MKDYDFPCSPTYRGSPRRWGDKTIANPAKERDEAMEMAFRHARAGDAVSAMFFAEKANVHAPVAPAQVAQLTAVLNRAKKVVN